MMLTTVSPKQKCKAMGWRKKGVLSILCYFFYALGYFKCIYGPFLKFSKIIHESGRGSWKQNLPPNLSHLVSSQFLLILQMAYMSVHLHTLFLVPRTLFFPPSPSFQAQDLYPPSPTWVQGVCWDLGLSSLFCLSMPLCHFKTSQFPTHFPPRFVHTNYTSLLCSGCSKFKAESYKWKAPAAWIRRPSNYMTSFHSCWPGDHMTSLSPGCPYLSYETVKRSNTWKYIQDVIFTLSIYALKENPIITEGRNGLAFNLSPYIDHFFPFSRIVIFQK